MALVRDIAEKARDLLEEIDAVDGDTGYWLSDLIDDWEAENYGSEAPDSFASFRRKVLRSGAVNVPKEYVEAFEEYERGAPP